MLKRLLSTASQRRSVGPPKLPSLSQHLHQNSHKPAPSSEGALGQAADKEDAPKSPKQFSKYINNLPDAYDAQLVEKAILVMGSTLNREESGIILSALRQRGTEKDMKRLRAVLSGPGRGMVTFEQSGLYEVVEGSVLKGGGAGDALQWLLLAQEQVGFSPDSATLQLLLKSTSEDQSWEALHFVCGEMERLGVPLRAEDVALLVNAASKQPHSRWRMVYDLLQRPAQAQTAGAATLVRGFQVLADAQQFSSVKALFDQLEVEGTSTHLALPSLGSAALRTKDFAFLKRVLCSSAKDLFAAEAGVAEFPAVAAVSGADGGEEEQTRWLSSFAKALWTVDSIKASAHVGLIVAWLLDAQRLDAATTIWNGHLSGMVQQQVESVMDLEAERVRSVDDAVEHLSRFGTKASSSSQPLVAQFLHDVLFNSSSSAPVAPSSSLSVPEPVTGASFSVHSGEAAANMIALLAITQDADGAAMVLSRSLKAGHLVPEKTMSTVLELLLRQGDHRLVLALLDVYLAASNTSAAPLSGLEVMGKAAQSLPRVAAPYLFLPVLRAYVEMGDVEGAVQLLVATIPSKGYIPRVSFYKTVIDALRQQGQHERAVEVYTISQQLYKELCVHGHEVRPNVPDQYGVAAHSLVFAALASCAEGRLAVPAMEIHASYEDSLSRGVLKASLGDRPILAEFVVRATAGEDFIQIVPQFVQSLRNARTPVVLTRELLTACLAAAVAQQNADVAKAIVSFVEQTQGRQVSEVIYLEALLDTLRSKFSYTDDDAVRNFLLSSQELKDIR